MTAQIAPEATPAVTSIAAFPELTRDEVFMIGTRRLWLRWPRFDDAEALARIGGDPRVAANTGTWPLGATAAFARERIAQTRADNAAGTRFAFAIVRRDAWDDAIGLIGFNSTSTDDGVVATGGYHLGPDYWGKSYASEALIALVGMIRLLTRIRTLTVRVMPHNAASARVLEKSGFVKTGESSFTTAFKGTFPVIDYQRHLNRAAGRTPSQKSA